MITRAQPYTIITDDDGSLTTGTPWTNSWVQGFLNAIDARWSRTTTVATGGQTVINPAEADVLICNNAADLVIRSLTAPTPAKPGKPLMVVANGAGNVYLNHQDASGTTPADRLVNVMTVGQTPLAGGSGAAIYVRDDVVDRWRLVAHEQGAALAWTPVDGSGAGLALTLGPSWYRVSGRHVMAHFYVGYPATGSAADALIAGLPFVSTNVALGHAGGCLVAYSNLGSGFYGLVPDNGSAIVFYNLSGAAMANSNWSAKTVVATAMYWTL